jgi:hypothetical protein
MFKLPEILFAAPTCCLIDFVCQAVPLHAGNARLVSTLAKNKKMFKSSHTASVVQSQTDATRVVLLGHCLLFATLSRLSTACLFSFPERCCGTLEVVATAPHPISTHCKRDQQTSRCHPGGLTWVKPEQ